MNILQYITDKRETHTVTFSRSAYRFSIKKSNQLKSFVTKLQYAIDENLSCTWYEKVGQLQQVRNFCMHLINPTVQMAFYCTCARYMHYENMPMLYTAIFHGCKTDNFQMKNCDVFLFLLYNIGCGYTLEPPH